MNILGYKKDGTPFYEDEVRKEFEESFTQFFTTDDPALNGVPKNENGEYLDENIRARWEMMVLGFQPTMIYKPQ